MHNLKLEEERKRITKEFEASYAQTVEEAQEAVAAVRKQCDEQVAVEQARFIQVKAEFEKYNKETDEKLSEAAAQNLSLQDQIDDLQYKLDMIAKARQSVTERPVVPRIEVATGSDVPVYNITTPKAPVAADTDAKAGDEEIPEWKAPAVLAQEAMAKLEQMLSKGTEAEPAAGDGKPRLPVQSSGFHTPTEPVKTPPNDSPQQQQQIMGASDLIALVNLG